MYIYVYMYVYTDICNMYITCLMLSWYKMCLFVRRADDPLGKRAGYEWGEQDRPQCPRGPPSTTISSQRVVVQPVHL